MEGSLSLLHELLSTTAEDDCAGLGLGAATEQVEPDEENNCKISDFDLKFRQTSLHQSASPQRSHRFQGSRHSDRALLTELLHRRISLS